MSLLLHITFITFASQHLIPGFLVRDISYQLKFTKYGALENILFVYRVNG